VPPLVIQWRETYLLRARQLAAEVREHAIAARGIVGRFTDRTPTAIEQQLDELVRNTDRLASYCPFDLIPAAVVTAEGWERITAGKRVEVQGLIHGARHARDAVRKLEAIYCGATVQLEKLSGAQPNDQEAPSGAPLASGIGEETRTPAVSEDTTKAGRGAKKNVNSRMLAEYQKNPESLNWSADQWAAHLNCSKSSVVESKTWGSLKLLKANEALKKREQQKQNNRKRAG
jgi:hypothetical protein